MLNEAANGKVRYDQIASWMSDAPARIGGLLERDASKFGYDADLVLVDPECKRTIDNEKQLTKSRWSPWHGVSLQVGQCRRS